MAEMKPSDMMEQAMDEPQNPPQAELDETEATNTEETDEVDETNEHAETDEVDETEASPDPRDGTIRRLQIGLTILSLVVVGLVVTVILLLSRGGAQSPETSSPAPYYSTNYVEVSQNIKPDAIVVEIHDDYQCPWCKQAEDIFGNALGELSQSGDIDLRIHIRTLVGDHIIQNDSSERAGRAALCADKVGYFWAYHSTIFANQPQEGVGYADDQLRDTFAVQAGITGQALKDFQTCYDTKATADEVSAMEAEGAQADINATPSFFVNGVQVTFNLQSGAETIVQANAAELLAELKQVISQ